MICREVCRGQSAGWKEIAPRTPQAVFGASAFFTAAGQQGRVLESRVVYRVGSNKRGNGGYATSDLLVLVVWRVCDGQAPRMALARFGAKKNMLEVLYIAHRVVLAWIHADLRNSLLQN